MDEEEEELENTLIGQEEEEAPVMNIPIAPPIPEGAVGSPQENFRQSMLKGEALTDEKIKQAEAFAESMGTTFDPASGYAPIAPPPATPNPEMGPMQFIDTRTGEPLAPEVVKGVQDAGLGQYLSQASFPVPQAPTPQAPAPQAPIAPMGQEETIARLGGRTLNEYLNAPAVRTPGISGLKTDPQGRMIPNQPIAPQPSADSAVPSTVAQTPAGELSDFEKDSLARQQIIGGTGSYAGDSAAREARLRANERQPGETQTERDTRIAESKTTGGQTQGLSFDDARRIAEGQLAAKGVRNPTASQVNALARGLQQSEPGRLAAEEAKREQEAYDRSKDAYDRSKDAYDRELSEAAEARRVAAEERAVAGEERAVAGEERKVREEERTIAAGIVAQEHAAKSQEQRDREISIKEQKLKAEIAELNKRNPTEGAKAADAEAFMDKEDLIFDNGVLYEKKNWGRGQMVKVTNPAFMDVPGMEFLRQKSMGATGNTPVDYSAFSVRAVGTPEPTTVTAPPAPTTVTVPPVTATNNTVTQQALNGVTQPAAVDPSARQAGETETSYRQRLMREETARFMAAAEARRLARLNARLNQ